MMESQLENTGSNHSYNLRIVQTALINLCIISLLIFQIVKMCFLM